jgi:hypothetical protein
LRNKEPLKLLDFLEFSGKLFGSDETLYSYKSRKNERAGSQDESEEE